ncbi:hypothetical protein PTKIN_Ptkin11bG0055700 [Pterospermum kingtungense]
MSIPNYKFQGTKQGHHINTDLDRVNDSFLDQYQGYEAEEDDEEELIRVVLRRKYPSSGLSCFHGLRADQKQKLELDDGKVRKTFSMRSSAEEDEKQIGSSSVVERAVRRAFSMRASSASVNEVYRRIDHHYEPVPVGDHHQEEFKKIMVETELVEPADHKKRNNNKILDACRRFFGF